VRRIFIREMTACFSTPVPYGLAGVFLCLSGLFFFHEVTAASIMASRMAQAGGGVSLDTLLLKPLFIDLSMLVVFLCPLVSMGFFPEAGAGGPSPAYPAGDARELGGRYLAAFAALSAMISLSGFLMAELALIAAPDWGLVLSSYLGLVLLGGVMLAMGAFAFRVSGHQAVAAALALGLAMASWTAGWCAPLMPDSWAGSVLQELSLSWHLSRFLEGVIALKDTVFFFELTVFFLALAFVSPGRARMRG
jgi:ABC-2 type transport system permease protein